MASSRDERNRILILVESGRLNANDAGRLLDALSEKEARLAHRATKGQRTLRVVTTNAGGTTPTKQWSASIPVVLLQQSVRLGAYIVPQLASETVADLLRAVEDGVRGCILDIQDLEQGQRLEVFVE